MSTNYYKVKLNNGNTHVIYEDDEVLEKMVGEGIIREYVIALDNFCTEKVFDNFISYQLENAITEICYHIQNVKGIKDGDCLPDFDIKMAKAIENVRDVIKEIIAYQEVINSVDNK